MSSWFAKLAQGVKKNRVRLAALLAALAIVALVVWLTGADKNKDVAVGQSVVVTVSADAFEDMYGYQFQLLYNADDFEYADVLTSDVEDITTIFSKPSEGGQLVGATLIGERPGLSGRNENLCQLTFNALKDVSLTEETFSLHDVRVVHSDLNLENAEDWRLAAAPADPLP